MGILKETIFKKGNKQLLVLSDLILAVGKREESRMTLRFLAWVFASFLYQDEKLREWSLCVGKDSQFT